MGCRRSAESVVERARNRPGASLANVKALAMTDMLARMITNMVGRVDGPLAFRLVLQPAMAAIAAIKAGIEDGRVNRPAYFWAVISTPSHRRSLLRDGWKDVGNIFGLALVIDVVYQLIVLRWVYPGESLLVAMFLAVVPYLAIRGPVGRMMRTIRVRRRKEA